MLYLVRHGRTEHNATRRLLGRIDVPLDELGRRQAAALGQVPVLQNANRVITSPLVRARDTAAALGPPVEVDPQWAEIDYGVHDGMPLDQVADLWREWGNDIAYTPEGGESIASLGARIRKACEEIRDEAADTDVVVVTHVSPIKAAIAWALQVGDEICWRMFVDVASVSRIGFNRASPTGPAPSLHSFNETYHRPST